MANVSIATVSRVINNHSNVAPEYCKRVQAAMEELNFHPNATAQSMRKSRSQTIGLLLPNLDDPFFGSIANHVVTTATQYSQNVMALISKCGNSYDELPCFEKLSEAPLDGLIYCSTTRVDPAVFNRYFENLPVVVCSRHDLLPNRPHVYYNHQKGGYLATKHLIDMGHRKIAIFVGNFGTICKSAAELEQYVQNPALAGPYSGTDKFIGARRALEQEHIPYYPELVEFIDLGNPYESGYLAMQNLLSRTVEFDAVFCANDLSAAGAIHMLSKQKIAVPEAVSVIGNDNSIMATCVDPQLSTIVQDTKALGSECVHTLNRLLRGESCSDVVIDVSLIIRSSSCSHIQRNPGSISID